MSGKAKQTVTKTKKRAVRVNPNAGRKKKK